MKRRAALLGQNREHAEKKKKLSTTALLNKPGRSAKRRRSEDSQNGARQHHATIQNGDGFAKPMKPIRKTTSKKDPHTQNPAKQKQTKTTKAKEQDTPESVLKQKQTKTTKAKEQDTPESVLQRVLNFKAGTPVKIESPPRRKFTAAPTSSHVWKHFDDLVSNFCALERALCLARVPTRFGVLQSTISENSGRNFSVDDLERILTLMPDDMYHTTWVTVDGHRHLTIASTSSARLKDLDESSRMLEDRVWKHVQDFLTQGHVAGGNIASIRKLRKRIGKDPSVEHLKGTLLESDFANIPPTPTTGRFRAPSDSRSGAAVLIESIDAQPFSPADGSKGANQPQSPPTKPTTKLMRGINPDLVNRIREKQKLGTLLAKLKREDPNAERIELLRVLLQGIVTAVWVQSCGAKPNAKGGFICLELTQFIDQLAQTRRHLAPGVPEKLLRLLSEEVVAHCRALDEGHPWCEIVCVDNDNGKTEFLKMRNTYKPSAVTHLLKDRIQQLKSSENNARQSDAKM